MSYAIVDSSFLEQVILNILHNKPIVEFEEKYREEKLTQRARIQELVDKISTGIHKVFNLSIFSAGDINIIDVSLNIVKDKNMKLNFYLSGRDLKTYCSRLPHFVVFDRQGKATHYPQNGSNFTKWYPFIGKCIPIMLNIATNFRLLELYLREQRAQKTIVNSKNILGIDIPIEIPDMYRTYSFLGRAIHNVHNPKKIKIGKYIFGKNGVTSENTTKIVRVIRKTFEHLEGKIYPKNIQVEDLLDFYDGEYQFGIGSLSSTHERLFVKIDNTIFIVDPWMKFIPKKTMEELSCVNNSIHFEFLQRFISDQGEEGSCVLCCVARMLYVVDSLMQYDFYTREHLGQIINEPITDFYAYLTHFVFRQSLFL
jgi:hypothetical protein